MFTLNDRGYDVIPATAEPTSDVSHLSFVESDNT